MRVAFARRFEIDVGKDLARARLHDHDAVGKECTLEHGMGDEDDGDAGLAPEPQHVVIEFLPGNLVERGERLVHQQQLGPGHQRAGDRNPHLHAARELARISVGEIGQPNGGQRRHDGRGGVALAQAPQAKRQEDIAEHRLPGHQRRLLKDEADVALRQAF